ncbi:hypothetical protein B1R32_10865 [Abditibacterium utsteinense]|uniref:Uncharacterized protein n=1 Tax=Abditibacterium utsteinense TaxID=1960156 RepID=A0A2S8SSW3_9BACT|nr:hypothetical protein [Abditibacterium utsteinense]PQV63858.1 hypothetical protein B1R32_10865 [Abditibacterium utsteinense]
MSEKSPSEIPSETQVEKKKSPLELVKERQAALGKNRNSKGAKPGSAADKAGGVAEAPTSKPMRSSASKQGG